MLFLLESPFAAFFAYFIFGEILSLTQWIGASIIFMSALGTLLLGGNHEKKENSSQKSSEKS
jgi:drug/metabolite transporter (DMT)-like permease